MNHIEIRNQNFIDAGWLYRYEFYGRFPFAEIVDWCNTLYKVGEDFTYAGSNFWFKKQEHYTWFLMRWS